MEAERLLRALLWVIAVLQQLRRVCGARHSVYWNSSNPRFLVEEYVLRVDINDYLDVYCPHYDARVPVEHRESFVLYMVDREGYDDCQETAVALKRWECNQPLAPYGPVKFSEKIQLFTPFSLGIEFLPGRDYYYISIPNADSDGRCLRLRLSVCCKPATVAPVTVVPKSQPRGGSPGDPRAPGRNFSPRMSASPILLAFCLLLWF